MVSCTMYLEGHLHLHEVSLVSNVWFLCSFLQYTNLTCLYPPRLCIVVDVSWCCVYIRIYVEYVSYVWVVRVWVRVCVHVYLPLICVYCVSHLYFFFYFVSVCFLDPIICILSVIDITYYNVL
jgi:hypothetical protein